MKKRYVIYFEGLFEKGYLQTTYTKKTQDVKLTDINTAYEFATKFKFKFWANFICWIANKTSSKEGLLRTFTVKEIQL